MKVIESLKKYLSAQKESFRFMESHFKEYNNALTSEYFRGQADHCQYVINLLETMEKRGDINESE